LTLTACGGGGTDQPTAVTAAAPSAPEQPTGTLEKAALAEAADVNCGYQNDLFSRLGPRGKTLAGIQAESAGSIPVLEEVQALQEGLEPAAAVAPDWEEYLKASQGVIDSAGAVVETPDDAAAPKAFAALEQARQKTYPPSDALGLKVCTFAEAATVEETKMENPASIELAEPSNTPEEAAEDLLAAIETGDCEKINAERHSDVGELAADSCQYLLTAYSGLDIIGSQSYGPAALVQFADQKDASRQGTTQFVIDTDGKLKYVSESVIGGGGIHPPSEGFDAQQTVDAALEAIRSGDSAAFAETLGPDGAYTESEDPLAAFSEESSGKLFTEAVKDNSDVDAVMIGASQAIAYFIFETGDSEFLIEVSHSPGSETEYRNPGYWALPSAGS
jgi:hypothetical protein